MIRSSNILFGIRNGNPLQYSSLESSMDREAWLASSSPQGCRVGHDSVTEHTHRRGNAQVNFSPLHPDTVPFGGLLTAD